MDLEIKNLNALITGASHGLGYSCAEVLLEESANVAISARGEKQLEEAREKLQKQSTSKVNAFKCDLVEKADIENLIEQVNTSYSGLDVLVISTGHPPTFPFSEATDEFWQRGIDLILQPAILLARAFIPSMRQKGYGRIIFIGSIFGLEPEASSVIQSTLRTGLNALSKCIATENAQYGITANVICPGYFHTPLVENLATHYAKKSGETAASVLDNWKDYSPMKKYGKPRDLGSLVSFLASPRAEFITGTCITIDGGAVRQW